ncbi:MAG TPA: glycosyltransferase family 2 protein [Armatimonadota bacterium]|nr:glycosyltransferase family 2 protein [Armatimonadota bacterium]
MRYSVAIPVLNEEETLPVLAERLGAALGGLGDDWEAVFVDDGSTDRSWEILQELHEGDARFGAVRLSRNFGHQAACASGLAHATGDVVILMDGDLQDPPELIPELTAKIDEGYDVVYAVKRGRREGWTKRLAFRTFYKVQTGLSSVDMPEGAGTFSALTRRVVDCINAMPESNRYVSGLRAYTGFRQTGLEFDRPARHAGEPRQTVGRLFKLAMDGIFSFSHVPAKLATWLGLIAATTCLVFSAVVLYKKLVSQTAILGWTSTMLSILFLGAVQLLCLGILGEYIARIYDEVRHRPLYVVADRICAAHSDNATNAGAH